MAVFIHIDGNELIVEIGDYEFLCLVWAISENRVILLVVVNINSSRGHECL